MIIKKLKCGKFKKLLFTMENATAYQTKHKNKR